MPESGSKIANWVAELRRRKVFRVGIVYLVAAWLLIQVADATFEPMGLPGWTIRLVIILAILGLPIACALAWAFDVTPHGIERTGPMAPPVVLPETSGAQCGAPPVGGAGAAKSHSIAILSFDDLSPGRDQEYFCDGMAEEIINALCCVSGLRVASRTSSFQFKGRATDVREIGRTLGVEAVLEGSVRKAGDRVRINAQLIDCGEGYHHWSESFDRNLDDVFAIQTEIARKLVRALQLTLTKRESDLIGRGGTGSAEAYDLYLKGQAELRQSSDTTISLAIDYFRQAIARDSGFAQAHAGLANAIAIKGVWRLGMTGQELDEAVAASRRALQLEPNMPEAFVARGSLLSLQGRTAEATEAFEEAIRLNPASYDAHNLYARHCFGIGETEKALRMFEAAMRLRPDEYQPQGLLSDLLEKLGRSDEARRAALRAMRTIELALERDPHDGRAMQLGAVQAARLGDVDKARALAAGAEAANPDAFTTKYNLACTYALLGDRELALKYLDSAVGDGRGSIEWIEHDSDFQSLRGDSRFESIIDRLRMASGRK